MKLANQCPCCSESMLRHTRPGSIYWFCPHCWQEMPNLLAEISEKPSRPLARLSSV